MAASVSLFFCVQTYVTSKFTHEPNKTPFMLCRTQPISDHKMHLLRDNHGGSYKATWYSLSFTTITMNAFFFNWNWQISVPFSQPSLAYNILFKQRSHDVVTWPWTCGWFCLVWPDCLWDSWDHPCWWKLADCPRRISPALLSAAKTPLPGSANKEVAHTVVNMPEERAKGGAAKHTGTNMLPANHEHQPSTSSLSGAFSLVT